jgi:hypothetical protein
MIKFNISLLMLALEQTLVKSFNDVEFDLTVRPSKGDAWTNLPPAQRDEYVKYISLTYKISIKQGVTFDYYLFVRNSRSSFGGLTDLSSIEIGYFEPSKFVSIFKRHFQAEMIPCLSFNSLGDVKSATKAVVDILVDVFAQDFPNHLPF